MHMFVSLYESLVNKVNSLQKTVIQLKIALQCHVSQTQLLISEVFSCVPDERLCLMKTVIREPSAAFPPNVPNIRATSFPIIHSYF